MLRIGFSAALLAFAACAAPATNETATSIEDAPGIRRGSQDGSIEAVIHGDARGPGGVMHIDISRPIVFSVGEVRVENEPLVSDWVSQVMNELSEQSENGVTKLSHESAEEIVRSIPLPPGAEMRIRFEAAE